MSLEALLIGVLFTEQELTSFYSLVKFVGQHTSFSTACLNKLLKD